MNLLFRRSQLCTSSQSGVTKVGGALTELVALVYLVTSQAYLS
jgi:hypothetical protein